MYSPYYLQVYDHFQRQAGMPHIVYIPHRLFQLIFQDSVHYQIPSLIQANHTQQIHMPAGEILSNTELQNVVDFI